MDEIITIPIPHLIAYIISVFALFKLSLIFFVNRGDIIKGLKGKDELWQFVELSGIVWLVIFPVVIVVDIFGIEVHSHTWAAMELVYFMNLSSKATHKYLDNKFKKDDTDTNK